MERVIIKFNIKLWELSGKDLEIETRVRGTKLIVESVFYVESTKEYCGRAAYGSYIAREEDMIMLVPSGVFNLFTDLVKTTDNE